MISDDDIAAILAALRPLLSEVAARAVTEAVRSVPRVTLTPATVVNVALTSPPTVSVLVDGDTFESFHQALISAPAIGDRVMILYDPPFGSFVIPFAPGGS